MNINNLILAAEIVVVVLMFRVLLNILKAKQLGMFLIFFVLTTFELFRLINLLDKKFGM